MMKLQLLKTTLVACIITATSGCASIVTDSTTAINVQTSNGQTVKVSMDGQQFNAPGTVLALKNGQDKVLLVEGDKCDSQTIVPKKIEAAFWGNILIGGFFGSTTDSSTAKMWTYQDTTTINCRS